MEERAPKKCDSIGRTLDVIGDRWTMMILRAIFRGLHRFDDLCIDLGIARPVLSDRLSKLVDAGVLQKVPYQEHPPRYDYRLTAMGIELSPTLVALVRWGERWFADSKADVLLVHGPCGTELQQGFWCDECQTTFGPLAIKSRPVELPADR